MKKLLPILGMTLVLSGLAYAGLTVGVAYGQEAIDNLRPGRTSNVKLAKVPVSHTGATTAMCGLTDSRECLVKNLSGQRLCLKYTASDTDCSAVTIVDGCAAETEIVVVPDGEGFFIVLDQDKLSNLCGKLEADSGEDCDGSPTSNNCVYATEAR